MATYDKALEEALNKKPAAYSSAWQEQMQALLESLMNRQDFTYHPEGDALYQNYRQQHLQLGKQAMLDTMGEAAALTGGYGNSYAQTAGQQAYAGQLRQLQEKIPALYELAQSRYRQQGEAISGKLSALQKQEETDYSRYRDSLDSWNKEVSRLQSIAEAQRDHDYRVGRDKVEDEQWKKEFDEAVRRFNLTRGV